MTPQVRFDFGRRRRVGIDEAVLCEPKSVEQIEMALAAAEERAASLLLTRLNAAQFDALSARRQAELDYCRTSRTAMFGPVPEPSPNGLVAIVSAGSSDFPVALEARRTLNYAGLDADMIVDVGVAGLWRLADNFERIAQCSIVIVVAGMDAALASVLGGLVGSALVCVPTSVGYGVASGGEAALNAMLASCAPGLLVTNIDNGYGAACAAIRMVKAFGTLDAERTPSHAAFALDELLRTGEKF